MNSVCSDLAPYVCPSFNRLSSMRFSACNTDGPPSTEHNLYCCVAAASDTDYVVVSPWWLQILQEVGQRFKIPLVASEYNQLKVRPGTVIYRVPQLSKLSYTSILNAIPFVPLKVPGKCGFGR